MGLETTPKYCQQDSNPSTVADTWKWTGAPNNVWLTSYASWDSSNNLTESVDPRGNYYINGQSTYITGISENYDVRGQLTKETTYSAAIPSGYYDAWNYIEGSGNS